MSLVFRIVITQDESALEYAPASSVPGVVEVCELVLSPEELFELFGILG